MHKITKINIDIGEYLRPILETLARHCYCYFTNSNYLEYYFDWSCSLCVSFNKQHMLQVIKNDNEKPTRINVNCCCSCPWVLFNGTKCYNVDESLVSENPEENIKRLLDWLSEFSINIPMEYFTDKYLSNEEIKEQYLHLQHEYEVEEDYPEILDISFSRPQNYNHWVILKDLCKVLQIEYPEEETVK
jgi:hydroxymethylpyrimidine pyrophosphatase-like HAD family hydrolase